MTDRELLYVKTAAEERSISQAAKKLFIAQPSLSQSLQRLEESLGTKLFQRTSTGLTLTYAGERYYQMACQMLKIYEDFENEISDINNLKTGRIHLGITSQLGTILLPLVLPEFRKRYPNIEIFIFEGSTGEQEDMLLSGQLDFSVMHAPKVDRNPMLDYEYLASYPFVIALCQEHALASKAQVREGYAYPVMDLQLLSQEPFIVLQKNRRIRHVTDAILQKAKIKPNIVLTISNYETAQALAGRGVGVTMLPEDYIHIPALEIPPVFFSIDQRYSPSWDLCIATRKDGFLSRAARCFMQMIRETNP